MRFTTKLFVNRFSCSLGQLSVYSEFLSSVLVDHPLLLITVTRDTP
jgi:hypothetical protein